MHKVPMAGVSVSELYQKFSISRELRVSSDSNQFGLNCAGSGTVLSARPALVDYHNRGERA